MAKKAGASVSASDVFPLVHALLQGAGMKEAAAALEKEAKLVRSALLDVAPSRMNSNRWKIDL